MTNNKQQLIAAVTDLQDLSQQCDNSQLGILAREIASIADKLGRVIKNMR